LAGIRATSIFHWQIIDRHSFNLDEITFCNFVIDGGRKESGQFLISAMLLFMKRLKIKTSHSRAQLGQKMAIIFIESLHRLQILSILRSLVVCTLNWRTWIQNGGLSIRSLKDYLLSWPGESYKRYCDLTKHLSLRMRKDECLCHDICR
jgi:hypothetical protein